MNKSYKLVWNEALGTWCVAHEAAKGRGKGKAKGSRFGIGPIAAAVLLV